MQDRFRFRCWRKLDNRMVEIYWFNPILFDEDAAGDRAKNYVLMQCTGLKDKNGKLIFEGDILKTKKHNLCEDDELFEVFYEETLCQFLGKSLATNICIDLCDLYGEEIVGNIYKNKDLLQ